MPARVRSLITIGTPVHGLERAQRLFRITPLVALYRLAGPNPIVRGALRDALLGKEAVAAQPDLARRVLDAFAEADRAPMLEAMRSAMLRRPDLTDQLAAIPAPTLMVAARDDADWSPDHARRAAARMPPGLRAPWPAAATSLPCSCKPTCSWRRSPSSGPRSRRSDRQLLTCRYISR